MATELHKGTQNAWRRFLASEEGKEGLLWLHEHIPTIKGDVADQVVFSAGIARGYSENLNNITELLGAKSDREVDASND